MILTSVFKMFLRRTRFLKMAVLALVGTAVLTLHSAPALAFGIGGSAQPSEGTTQLDNVYEESKEVSNSNPRGMGEVQKKASEGINGVQGAADMNKMKSPGDSPAAQTVKDDVKDAFEAVTD